MDKSILPSRPHTANQLQCGRLWKWNTVRIIYPEIAYAKWVTYIRCKVFAMMRSKSLSEDEASVRYPIVTACISRQFVYDLCLRKYHVSMNIMSMFQTHTEPASMHHPNDCILGWGSSPYILSSLMIAWWSSGMPKWRVIDVMISSANTYTEFNALQVCMISVRYHNPYIYVKSSLQDANIR